MIVSSPNGFVTNSLSQALVQSTASYATPAPSSELIATPPRRSCPSNHSPAVYSPRNVSWPLQPQPQPRLQPQMAPGVTRLATGQLVYRSFLTRPTRITFCRYPVSLTRNWFKCTPTVAGIVAAAVAVVGALYAD